MASDKQLHAWALKHIVGVDRGSHEGCDRLPVYVCIAEEQPIDSVYVKNVAIGSCVFEINGECYLITSKLTPAESSRDGTKATETKTTFPPSDETVEYRTKSSIGEVVSGVEGDATVIKLHSLFFDQLSLDAFEKLPKLKTFSGWDKMNSLSYIKLQGYPGWKPCDTEAKAEIMLWVGGDPQRTIKIVGYEPSTSFVRGAVVLSDTGEAMGVVGYSDAWTIGIVPFSDLVTELYPKCGGGAAVEEVPSVVLGFPIKHY
ncbi:hypothetical protein F4780DRAFT_765096 [Xylariomycetidae sp. FL0641]|nr:hypothetical protein F4780DRAFT_765096 [Xylariomycetidae sp. FL0641]